MKRSVFLSTFLFAAVLSPITLQPYTCGPPPAEARLALLELRVGDFAGENVIEGFNPNVFSYDVRFPESESVGVLWVKTNHPSTMVDVEYDGLPVQLRGQSVAELDVPLETSELTIHVTRRGPTPDSNTYVVRIERVPVFPCTEQGIRDAIAYGGGPNFFGCDEPTTVLTEAEIVIDNDVILDGEGNLIVDAGGGAGGPGGAGGAALTAAEVAPKAIGPHRVFSIPEGVMAELIGFTVTGGANVEEGGGILNAGVLTLTTSTVTANAANRGGGILNLEAGSLTVEGSTVSMNAANEFGGGIQNFGQAALVDTEVSRNTAGNGAAAITTGFDQPGAVMTVTRSRIDSNVALQSVGGISNYATLDLVDSTVSGNMGPTTGGIRNRGNLSLTRTNISSNASEGDGGGILNEAVLLVTDSSISGNAATSDGGGIFNEGTSTLTNSTVSGNSADRGGGVASFAPGTLTVMGSTVSGNTANLAGGLGTAGPAEVIDTTVSSNTALVSGGGVGIAMGGNLTLTGSVIEGNYAAEIAGGIGSESDTTMTLNATTVANNEAGTQSGGIENSGSASLNDSMVVDNRATNFNGGIGNSGLLTLNNTMVARNSVVGDGGGIGTIGVVTLRNSTVSENTATGFSGGIGNNGELTLIDSTVSNNSCGLDGGGIASFSGTTTLSNTTVSGNSAGAAGGGISGSGLLTLTGSSVTGNTSSGNGGGIVSYGDVTVTESSISGNHSGNAGGIYLGYPGLLMVANSTLSENTTEGSGGGIDIDGSVTLTNSMITGNTAERQGGGIYNGGLLEAIDTTVSNNTTMRWSGGVQNADTLMLIRTTVTGNTSAIHSGGIGNAGTATLTNVTVSHNQSDTAGGIRNYVFGGFVGTMTIVNTTVSDNVASNGATGIQNENEMSIRNTIVDGDCVVLTPLLSLGGNIESPGNTCDLFHSEDRFFVTPAELNLGPLANNGGHTQTHALLSGSVAIDWVPVDACVDADGFPLLTDQRGVSRPQGPACDSGSFELGDGTQPTGACVNEVDRATYESLEYVDDQGMLWTCIDAASEIGSDCVFGSPQSEPPLEGCGAEAGAVIACFPNCPEEVIEAFGDCVASCAAGATGLSSVCAGCYGEAAACAAAFCTFSCAGDFNSPPCVECRIENGCIPGFDTCSGLPGDIDCGGTGGTGGTGGNNPPVVDYVAWEYGVDCEGFGATTLQVTVSANDADDPTGETLTYSGSLQWCDPFSVTSTPSPVTQTVNCELSFGLESLVVTVADPQGNEDTISAFFESALCQGGCVENPEGQVGCPGGTGGTGGTGGVGGTGGAPMLCADGQLRCSADLTQIEMCFNDFWEPYEECPPESVCQEEPDVSCVAPSVIVGDGIWDANGHQYIVVEFRGQTWDTSNADLSNQLSGFHLATITSQEEQDFVNNLVAGLISGELWLGGFQDPITELDPVAGWTWVTGEPWVYTNWLSDEPNDTIGVEQHLALDRGGWNDEGSAIGAVGGYLAESFDPVAP